MKLYMYHDKCMHAYTPGTSGRCVCLLIAKTSKPLAAHWQRSLGLRGGGSIRSMESRRPDWCVSPTKLAPRPRPPPSNFAPLPKIPVHRSRSSTVHSRYRVVERQPYTCTTARERRPPTPKVVSTTRSARRKQETKAFPQAGPNHSNHGDHNGQGMLLHLLADALPVATLESGY